MKTNKPRNYVVLAMMKRSGSGAHCQSNKAKRAESKQQLQKELKKPSEKSDGFLFFSNLVGYNFS